MNKSCKELQRIARENLNNRYTIPMGATIVASLIIAMIELPFSMLQTNDATLLQTISFYIAEFLIFLLSIVLSVGEYKIHLSMARKEKYSFGQLFYVFKNQPDRYLIAGFIQILLLVLTLIPMIAGIAAAYFYTQTITILLAIVFSVISLILTISVQLKISLIYFLFLDHENLNVMGAFGTSRRLMKNNTTRLFYMELSFIGMQMLCLISFGIASFWVTPYQNQTLTNFYLDVIGELPEILSKSHTVINEQPSFDKYV